MPAFQGNRTTRRQTDSRSVKSRTRGGFSHVRPNRGPHKKGAPQATDCRTGQLAD